MSQSDIIERGAEEVQEAINTLRGAETNNSVAFIIEQLEQHIISLESILQEVEDEEEDEEEETQLLLAEGTPEALGKAAARLGILQDVEDLIRRELEVEDAD
jgi:hypothetical protein